MKGTENKEVGSNVKVGGAGLIADATIKNIELSNSQVSDTLRQLNSNIKNQRELERQEFVSLRAQVSTLTQVVDSLQVQIDELKGKIK
jgi:hypothetical protein